MESGNNDNFQEQPSLFPENSVLEEQFSFIELNPIVENPRLVSVDNCSVSDYNHVDSVDVTIDLVDNSNIQETNLDSGVMGSLVENVEINVASSSVSGENVIEFDFLEDKFRDGIGIEEEKRDFSAEGNRELGIGTQCIEESNCVLLRQPDIASECEFEVPSSLTRRALLRNDWDWDGLTGNPNFSNLVDSLGQPDTEAKELFELDTVSVSTSSDNVLSPPRRSTRRNKFCQMGETGKTAVQRGRRGNKKFFHVVRRKRSCFCKRARLSVWGSLGNLMQIKENEVREKDGNLLVQVENLSSQQRRVAPGNGMRQKSHAGTSQSVKEKCCPSSGHTGHFRLKVKMEGKDVRRGPNVVQSEVLDSLVSVPDAVSKCTNQPGNLNSFELSGNGVKHKVEDNLYDGKQFGYPNGDVENPVAFSGAHILDSLHVEKDLESTLTQDTSVTNNAGICLHSYSQIGTGAVEEEAIGKPYSDPGTSPDSEVVNSVQDVGIGADAVLTSNHAVGCTDTSALNMELVSLRKQKKGSRIKGTTDSLTESFAAEEKLLGQGKQNKAKRLLNHKQEEEVGHDCNPSVTVSSLVDGVEFRNSSNVERHTNGSTDIWNRGGPSKVETSNGSSEFSGEHIGLKSSDVLAPKGLADAGKNIGMKSSSKLTLEVRKQRSIAPVSARNRRKSGSEKSVNIGEGKEKCSLGQVVHKGSQRKTGGEIKISPGMTKKSESRGPPESRNDKFMGLEIPNDLGRSTANNVESVYLSNSSRLSSGLDGQLLSPPSAWVLCDDCSKWRCISTELADSIEATNCRWTCKDNMDKAFGDCSIPQEKSNAEINAELEISEASGEEDASYTRPMSKGFEEKQLSVPQQAPWKPIESNLFLHRSRKSQTIDEVIHLLFLVYALRVMPFDINMFSVMFRMFFCIQIMICHCKPPLGGGLGCGDECLNRMLNIECVQGTCPCGDLCSNQQFQKRMYVKLEQFRCGKKGYGLQLLENVSEGNFLIEYVGEVLDLNAYEARQREYASRGQRHFYFMTLNGSEVIDACAKGNLGRFINHSCDPNCRTEKWMVNGEVCIGLFAMRRIKKGEELTFDYNYVRVFGAAAKKCVCGSSDCRGYIGGDPQNTEVVVQGDSDEEFPEPVMVDEDAEVEEIAGRVTFNSILSSDDHLLGTYQNVVSAYSVKHSESFIQKEGNISRSGTAVQLLKIPSPMEETRKKSLSSCKSLEMSIQTDGGMNDSSSSIQPLEISLLKEDTESKNLSIMELQEASSTITDTSKFSHKLVTITRNSISDTAEDRPNVSKAHTPVKSSRSSSSIKKGKYRSTPVIASKPLIHANKPKKLGEGAANNRLRGVEEKLNELLDSYGGISKRKRFISLILGYDEIASAMDATKGYLKLLFVTASSGDNVNGEAVQSTRGLSIILDALLKTKKRSVLNDIISKNGLQMLHNIMKQNHKHFNRIPIIRKLLKILEYLAEKEILTVELIHSAPPCAGMESFKDSIIRLTRHTDTKVHQIARNFRDKWMPRALRNCYSNRDDFNEEQQAGLGSTRFPVSNKRWGHQGPWPMEEIDSVSQTTLAANPLYANIQNHSSGAKTRKRKSRWDQPEENSDLQSLELIEDQKRKQKLVASLQQPEIREAAEEQVGDVNGKVSSHGCDQNVSCEAENATSIDQMQQIQDEAPPGFASPIPMVHDAFSTATENHPSDVHQRTSREVVAGSFQEIYLSHLPVSYGVPLFFLDQLGTTQPETVDCWEVSPGIPFHPFPPLPPYQKQPSALIGHVEGQRDCDRTSYNQADSGSPCTSGTRPQEVAKTGVYNQQRVEQMRCSTGNLGKRYFRQQKWNNNARCPPWIRNRNGWGSKANNFRSGAHSLGVGNFENEVGNVCHPEGVSGRGEYIDSDFYQNPQNQYEH
ncbi:hypothetical protein IFM89_001819 [Coptis chinensis]|uniref:Histone-lysine N-methyltransferase ASHH2 n=1 Tax=Coptis chinensis TaxID=261450 RepID=A0A835LLC8_9MAGN|nr:hypothetical protein IFM89_001819 [Coptis chinensis]